jgi:biotin operon repressor
MNERPKVIQFTGSAPRNDHRWTTDELKQLISMWMAGDEVDNIAVVFGVTPRGINRQIQRMRANGILVPRRKRGHRAGRSNQLWTPEEVEYLVRRRNERASTEEIANELNRTFNAIQGMVERLKAEGVIVRSFGRGKHRLWNAERLRDAISLRGLSDKAETDPSRLLSNTGETP